MYAMAIRLWIVFLMLASLSVVCKGQNTAYFTFNNQYYTFNKVMKTSSNEYVAVAYSVDGYTICKMDAVFNTLWSKQILWNNVSNVLDIAETNLGNYVFLLDNVDSSFVLKVNSQGVVLASKYFSSNTINFFTPTNLSNSLTGDGIILTGGYCNVENYCIRLDDNLNVVWQYQYRDGTGTCANSRSSDIITENTKYVLTSNPSSGGIDLLNIDDNGTVQMANNFNVSIQAGGYPLGLIRLSNGALVASWASANISNGTEYIFIDSLGSKAIKRKYNLGAWYYMKDYFETTPNVVWIGGTNQVLANGVQTNVLHAVGATGNILWTKTSETMGNAMSPSQLNTFAKGLDNSIFAFGGSGLNGAYGAKLSYTGNGFCNSANLSSSIMASDSVNATNRTITRLNLTALVTGNKICVLQDKPMNKKIECGILDNTPLALEEKSSSTELEIYPVPFSNTLHIKNANRASRIEMRNTIGTVVRNYAIDYKKGEIVLYTNELAHGMYYLQIMQDGIQRCRKILKQ
jgi:hypothetical protein